MTDDRRVPDLPPPVGTTVLDGPGIDEDDVRQALGWVRTAVAIAIGIFAACWLALAVVVALTAQHALAPERPLAAVSVVLSVPEARTALAADMVADLEDENGTPFAPEEQAELAEALEGVLASDELLDQLATLPVVDGQIDGAAVMATISRELVEQGEGRPPRIQVVLRAAARQIPELAEKEGTTADVSDTVGVIEQIRGYAFIAAAALLVPALVCGTIAAVVARRRSLAAASMLAGGLLLASAVLAPGRFVLDHLPGPMALPGGVLAALGSLVGSGWLWTIALLGLLPPIVWWAIRALRRSRPTDEVTGLHWVP